MDMMVIGILAGFLIVFPLFWCAIVFFISRLAWARYATEFGTDRGRPSDGQVSTYQALRFGPWYFGPNYNNVVTIGIGESGLFLAPSLFLFRPGHRDLLIPWSKIDRITPGKFLWFAINAIEVRGGYPRLTIFRPIGDAVRRHWEAANGRGKGA